MADPFFLFGERKSNSREAAKAQRYFLADFHFPPRLRAFAGNPSSYLIPITIWESAGKFLSPWTANLRLRAAKREFLLGGNRGIAEIISSCQ